MSFATGFDSCLNDLAEATWRWTEKRPGGSHTALDGKKVWNRRYMEPKPGYTLEQLWADSEPTISKKTSTSYEIQTNDVLRAVTAIQHLSSPTPPDSPFLRR